MGICTIPLSYGGCSWITNKRGQDPIHKYCSSITNGIVTLAKIGQIANPRIREQRNRLMAGVAKLQRLCIQGPVDKLGIITKTMNHTSYFMSDFVLNLVLYPCRIASYSLFHVSLPFLVLLFLLKMHVTTMIPHPTTIQSVNTYLFLKGNLLFSQSTQYPAQITTIIPLHCTVCICLHIYFFLQGFNHLRESTEFCFLYPAASVYLLHSNSLICACLIEESMSSIQYFGSLSPPAPINL